MASSFSQRRRKQSKPRHLNKEPPFPATEILDARAGDGFGAMNEQYYCENCHSYFHDPENFIVHLRSCSAINSCAVPELSLGRNSVGPETEVEPDELSENETYSVSDYRLGQFGSEQVSRYEYLNAADTPDDDDDSSGTDSQNESAGEEQGNGANKAAEGRRRRRRRSLTRERVNAENMSTDVQEGNRKRQESVSSSSGNASRSPDVMSHSTSGAPQVDGNLSRLIESGLAAPLKMLDLQQLYVVLIHLQQQQLLQLRMLDVIQKRLAENMVPSTGEIVAGLPELIAPLPVSASLFSPMPPPPPPPPPHGFAPNGFPRPTGTPGTSVTAEKPQVEGTLGESHTTWSKHTWSHLSHLANQISSSTSLDRFDHGANDRNRNEKADKQSAGEGGAGAGGWNIEESHRTVTSLPVGHGDVSPAETGAAMPLNLLQQISSKAPLLNCLPLSSADISDAFKKGKAASNQGVAVSQLKAEQQNSADAPQDDSAIFRHRCRLCFKILGSDSALQIHMRSHTGERPYKCNICGNRFTTKGNLKVHFARHQEQYPHIRMNPDPVPEYLDQLGHQQPAAPPPLPPGPSVAPTTAASRPPSHSNFYASPHLMHSPAAAATNFIGKVSALTSSPSLIPPSTASSTPIGHGSSSKLYNNDHSVKSEYLSRPDAVSKHPFLVVDPKDGVQQRSSFVSNDVQDVQSKVVMTDDVQSSSGQMFPSPLSALSSMSSALPNLKSPLNLTFPAPLAMSNPGMAMLPPYPPPALLSFSRSSMSAKEDDPLEQFMEVQLSESGKLDELVKEGEGKVSDPNECAVCHRVLSCRSALQMHYRTHTGERPYRCKLCSRTFTTKGNLKTHMSVHRGKPNTPSVLRCPVCSRDFTNPLILQQHMRVHANEPPKHLPLNGTPMMMPMLNHFLPFPMNFPYFGHALPPFQNPVPLFGHKEQKARSNDERNPEEEEDEEEEEEEETGIGEPLRKQRKISNEEDEDGKIEKVEDAMQRSRKSTDRMNSETISGNQDNESEISAADDGEDVDYDDAACEADHRRTTNSADDDTTKDSEAEKLENCSNEARNEEEESHMSISGRNVEEETEANDKLRAAAAEAAAAAARSPPLSPLPTSSSLSNAYPPYSSLTSQYSSPLTALEERVNALWFPAQRFRQGCQSEPGLDATDVNGKTLKTETEDEAAAAATTAFRYGTPYKMLEQQQAATRGVFGDVANMFKFGAGGLSSQGGLSAGGSPLEMQLAADGGKPSVVCQVCGKSFACRSALEIHLRSHTKEKPFHCHICKRAFSTKGNMKQHVLMTHSLSSTDTTDLFRNRPNTPGSSDGSQPTRCSPPVATPVIGLSGLMLQQVGEGSSDNSASLATVLTSDQSAGANATPQDKKNLTRYLCNVCKKPFSSTSALEIHMRTHTGDRPFVCTLCSKAFTTKGNLKVHMGTHAWNKCPSRRGRRMLMDPLSSFKTPPNDAASAAAVAAMFGRFPQPPAAETFPLAMLNFPEYFLPKPSSADDAGALNGFNSDDPRASLTASKSTPESRFSRHESSTTSMPIELSTKVKMESNNNRSSVAAAAVLTVHDGIPIEMEVKPRTSLTVTAAAAAAASATPAKNSYSDLATPAAAVQQTTLLWPTELSQNHQQQVALNCR